MRVLQLPLPPSLHYCANRGFYSLKNMLEVPSSRLGFITKLGGGLAGISALAACGGGYRCVDRAGNAAGGRFAV